MQTNQNLRPVRKFNEGGKMKLYSTQDCPQCKRLKNILERNGHEFEELDLRDPTNLADLRCMGIFSMSAPILVIQEDPLIYVESGPLSVITEATILDLVRQP